MPLCLYHYVYSIVYIFCIQLSVNGHLSCLHDLAIMNSAAIKKKTYFWNFANGILKAEKNYSNFDSTEWETVLFR